MSLFCSLAVLFCYVLLTVVAVVSVSPQQVFFALVFTIYLWNRKLRLYSFYIWLESKIFSQFYQSRKSKFQFPTGEFLWNPFSVPYRWIYLKSFFSFRVTFSIADCFFENTVTLDLFLLARVNSSHAMPFFSSYSRLTGWVAHKLRAEVCDFEPPIGWISCKFLANHAVCRRGTMCVPFLLKVNLPYGKRTLDLWRRATGKRLR